LLSLFDIPTVHSTSYLIVVDFIATAVPRDQ
jgi:hypothetical protein